MEVLSVGDVPWVKLAEKLGMMTLTQLYEDSPTPCQHLLQHYKVTLRSPGCGPGSDPTLTRPPSVCLQLGGGPVEGLVEALQSLGLTEGVRLLRNSELRDDKHSSGQQNPNRT